MRLTTVQTNFTAGVLSPRTIGRTDLARYNNGVASAVNCFPVISGGMQRRSGTIFSKAAKYGDRASRLVPFIVNRDTAYMLEFGDLYVRVYQPNGVYTGIEIASPYSAAMLADTDYTQSANAMFLWNESVFPQRLRRISLGVWDLSPVPFVVQPFDELGHVLAAGLTLSATTGVGVTATASSAVFLPSDVGRDLISMAGYATVTAYTSPTVVVVTITSAFPSTTLAVGTWYLDFSPQAFIVPSAVGPVGASVTLTGAATRAATLTLTAKTGSITVTASAGVFTAGDTGKQLFGDLGVATLTYVSATSCTAVTSTDFGALSYISGAWAITASVWRSPDDVGHYVQVNGGLLKVTAATATVATATVVNPMTSLVASPPFAWSIQQAVWNTTNGYPRTGTIHQQRVWCAGSTRYPQTLWGSRTGLYLDFTKGSNDSDACIFEIASDEVNPITYLCTARDMIVHTYGGEFSMRSPSGKSITPTSVDVQPESPLGSKGVRPITAGKDCVFVQRSGLKLRAMGYSFQIDGYDSPDLSVLCENITLSGITSMAYEQEPNQLLWLTLGDGRLLSCTVDRAQNVTAWAEHITDGAFESVATIPVGSFQQTWVIVRRTVNGAVARYVEYMDATFAPDLPGVVDPLAYPPIAAPEIYGCTVDAGKKFDNAGGQLVFAVPHLIGKTVDILADGLPQAPQVVALDGTVTIGRPSFRTLIGLHFNSSFKMLTPEVQGGTGSAQGNSMHTGEITIDLLNTLGIAIKDGEGREQDVPFRTFGPDVLDTRPPLYTGLHRLEMLGWERGRSDLTIEQNQPMPMQVLAIIRKFTVND